MMFLPIILAISANGLWVNYTVPCTNSSIFSQNSINTTNSSALQCVSATYTQNFPWWGTIVVVLWYITLYGWFGAEPGREKYITIAFLGLIFVSVTTYYQWTASSVWDSSLGIFLLVFFFVKFFGS